MSDKITKSPRLEFAGFADDWEQRKSGDVFVTVSDKGYTDLPVLSASQKFGMIRRGQIGINIKYDERSIKNYKRVKPGQFVIHLRSFQGGFYWSNIEGITSPAYTILDYKNPENQVSKFWKEVLTSSVFIKRLETITYGIRDGRSISFTDFSTLKFHVPSVEEQIKIGTFFKELDHLITLHQRKLELLKGAKKEFASENVPEDGTNVPEVRFPGFTDAWERKLGDVVEFFSGLTYSPDNVIEDGGTFVLRSSNVKNGEIVDADNVYVSSDIVNSDNVQVGDIIVVVRNGSRDLIGKHAQIKKQMNDTVIGAFMTGVRSETPNFTNAMLDTQQFSIEINKNLGATINQITTGAFRKMMFYIPIDKAECEQVGAFFNKLDNLIALHQRDLDTYKKIKKSMLQQMFI